MNSIVETNLPGNIELDIVTEDSNFQIPESNINTSIVLRYNYYPAFKCNQTRLYTWAVPE